MKPGRPLRIGLAILAVAASVVSVTAGATVSCGVSITVPADFGDYDVFAPAPTDVTGSARVSCTLLSKPVDNVRYTLALSAGTSGVFLPSRQMASGTNLLDYNLCTNASRSRVWGDGSGATRTVSGTIRFKHVNQTKSRNRSIYGRIPAAQDAAIGNYADVLTMTMTFRALIANPI